MKATVRRTFSAPVIHRCPAFFALLTLFASCRAILSRACRLAQPEAQRVRAQNLKETVPIGIRGRRGCHPILARMSPQPVVEGGSMSPQNLAGDRAAPATRCRLTPRHPALCRIGKALLAQGKPPVAQGRMKTPPQYNFAFAISANSAYFTISKNSTSRERNRACIPMKISPHFRRSR